MWSTGHELSQQCGVCGTPLASGRTLPSLGVAILARRSVRRWFPPAVWALSRILVALGLAERVPFLSPREDYPCRTFVGRRRQME